MKGPSRRNSNRNRLARVVVITSFVLLVGWITPKAFSLVGSVVMYPFHTTHVWLSESSSLVPTFIRDRQSLMAENEQLQNDLVVAQRSQLTNQRLLDENNRLRTLLGYDKEARIAASVIARPDELPYDLIQIDRGTSQGIEVGAPVFVGKDVVLGLVVHSASEYSFVRLFTSPDFRATVFVSGPDVVAELVGLGGGSARVRMPQGIPMNVGNLVYVPSIEPGVFGRISYIENEPTQPEQYGYVTPDLALSSIFAVSVGRLSQISQSPEVIEERIQEEIERTVYQPQLMGLTATSTATSSEQSATTTDEL